MWTEVVEELPSRAEGGLEALPTRAGRGAKLVAREGGRGHGGRQATLNAGRRRAARGVGQAAPSSTESGVLSSQRQQIIVWLLWNTCIRDQKNPAAFLALCRQLYEQVAL